MSPRCRARRAKRAVDDHRRTATSRPLRARSSAWAACLIQRDTRRDIRAPALTGNQTLQHHRRWERHRLDANTVLLNGITVEGNVTLVGSEGTATDTNGDANPWAIKTNTIGGDLVVEAT